MKATRIAAAAIVAAAALALTACGPDDTSTSAGSSPSAAASSAASTPTAAPSAAPSTSAKPTAASPAKPTGAAKPTATKSSGTTPGSDCTQLAMKNFSGQVVEATDNGYLTHIWMKAKPAKFVCGPDIPDDGYFEGYGTPALYSFSNDVKTFLLNGAKPVPVDLDTFMKHQDACLHSPSSVTAPYSCYGNKYIVTLTGQNEVTSITELYHP
ncbi:hypothetical protein E6W39_26605 [Kitasatospora acidiphila]|uniref:Uncharacterized protein n=1 Tax=Kitasatospora acidiphila TaxID=2567942 RepID=A0A540W8A0_9ACTN|nr:hypothetical protein [Kitasatospora acidiphila]TQF05157.1 hypothetical protein E6W39_26605 [Kitasatospora acidiphila]